MCRRRFTLLDPLPIMLNNVSFTAVAALVSSLALSAHANGLSEQGVPGTLDASKMQLIRPLSQIEPLRKSHSRISTRAMDFTFPQLWFHEEWGLPFTNARVPMAMHRVYPQSAVGKLVMTSFLGEAFKFCSASLVRPGVVLTVAACVTEQKENGIFRDFRFAPGWHASEGREVLPFGDWKGKRVYFSKDYITAPSRDGDLELASHESNIALVVLEENSSGKRAGDYAGHLGLRILSAQEMNTTHRQKMVTQVGYSLIADGSSLAQRVDAFATIYGHKATNEQFLVEPISDKSRNTLIHGGTMQAGGLGGPVVLNWQIEPQKTGVSVPDSRPNQVIAITWSYFTQKGSATSVDTLLNANTEKLLAAACKDFPKACAK
jgi:V8-like Glu-specific endopeptidase